MCNLTKQKQLVDVAFWEAQYYSSADLQALHRGLYNATQRRAQFPEHPMINERLINFSAVD